MRDLDRLDIVISIYNQEKLITRVLAGIFNSTTTPFNLVLVFDGCTDKSQEVGCRFIKDNKPALLKDIIITTANNVYETKANNIGFRLSKEDYIITVQDDVVIEEKGWERRLTYPLRKFNDVFAVTSRAAVNLKYHSNDTIPRYEDCAGREFWSLPRNMFAIRNTVNRGPIAFRTDILKKLNYLDGIFAPGQFDEADLVLRAQEQYQMKCGVFFIDYRSDLNWGKTRTGTNKITSSENVAKNAKLLKDRHPAISTAEGNIIEHRFINEKDIDYTDHDIFIKKWFIHLRASKRFFLWFITRKLKKIMTYLKSKIPESIKKFINSTF